MVVDKQFLVIWEQKGNITLDIFQMGLLSSQNITLTKMNEERISLGPETGFIKFVKGFRIKNYFVFELDFKSATDVEKRVFVTFEPNFYLVQYSFRGKF